MLKRQPPRVQHLSRKVCGEFRAVNFIAQHWMPEVMKVNPDLMGSAAVQRALDQAESLRPAKHAIFSLRCATAFRLNRHSLAIHGMPANFLLNYSCHFAQFSPG